MKLIKELQEKLNRVDFKKGDKVMTPDGEGVVQDPESMIHNEYQVRLKNKKLVYVDASKMSLCEAHGARYVSAWEKPVKGTVAGFSKFVSKFALWQLDDGGYSYELTNSVQSKHDKSGKFGVVETFKDSLDKVKEKLKKDGYKEIRK